MVRVGFRIGWGRGSAGRLALAFLNLLLAAFLFSQDLWAAPLIVLSFAAVATVFALVHADRVLETDEEHPQLKVGDIMDD